MIITHNTGKAELCFVKVPEDAYDFEIKTCEKLYSGDSVLTYKTKFRWETFQKSNWDWTTRSESKLEIVGNPFELSQEVIKDLVPEMRDSGFPFEVQEITDTWKELLIKWGIYQTNPYGNLILQDSDAGSDLETEIYPRWKMAQERNGSFILLKKIV